MEETTTMASIWPILLPVILGGLLALLGSAVGPIASHIWAHRTATQQLRVERFEELLSAIAENDHVLDQKRQARVFGGDDVQLIAPIHRAKIIAALYFPDLTTPLDEVENAMSRYELWMYAAAQKRINGEIDSFNEGFEKSYKPYRAAVTDFHKIARDYAATKKGRV